jgi:hypothetical protein
MSNDRSVMKLLIVTQIFTLLFLIFMPTLLRLLSGTLGKTLFAALTILAVGLSIALRHALKQLE